MRILITGIEGFTGVYLKKELENSGHEVFGLSANLLDFNRLEKEIKAINPDCAAHLAAQSFVHTEAVAEIYQTNIIGTYNFLSALHKSAAQIKSILLASSATVYGNKEGCLNEHTPLAPPNDYAVSKMGMEKMAKLWFDRLPIFIVRPFNYTGVGQKEHFLIPKIVDHFKRKTENIVLGNIQVSREFQDVRIVVKYYKNLIVNPPLHQTLNICSGISYALEDVIGICQELANHKLNIEVDPQFIRKNDAKDLKGDPTLLRSVIGEKLSDNLKDTLKWMLNYQTQKLFS
jgi:nucleoside-diphosphate-sugar epimerase